MRDEYPIAFILLRPICFLEEGYASCTGRGGEEFWVCIYGFYQGPSGFIHRPLFGCICIVLCMQILHVAFFLAIKVHILLG